MTSPSGAGRRCLGAQATLGTAAWGAGQRLPPAYWETPTRHAARTDNFLRRKFPEAGRRRELPPAPGFYSETLQLQGGAFREFCTKFQTPPPGRHILSFGRVDQLAPPCARISLALVTWQVQNPESAPNLAWGHLAGRGLPSAPKRCLGALPREPKRRLGALPGSPTNAWRRCLGGRATLASAA